MKTTKYLLIGLVLSLTLHLILFLTLYLLTPKDQPPKKEKQIFIKIVPKQPSKKISKTPSVKKEKKKGIPKKTKKPSPKPKKTKKDTPKKTEPKKSKPKKQKPQPPKTQKPKQEKIAEQKTQPKEPPKQKEIKEPKIKPAEPVNIEISNEINQELEKDIQIPDNLFGLKGISDKTKISAEKKDKPKKTEKEIENYLKYIKEEFEKNKFYPLKAKKLGIEGTVIIKFTILPDGTIDTNSIEIIYSDSPILSYGAKRIFEKIKKIPKPPPERKEMTVEIPIEYILIEL
ncbi:MAG: TonB family protein [Aquificae bacterium]|nr:TonB family protein [Aquificota bacterium]